MAQEIKKKMNMCGKSGGGGAYFLGFLGALVFYIQQASTFGEGLLGILKALVWPAFLVYGLLDLIK